MEATERMANELPENYEELPEERKKYQKYLWNTGFQFGDWLMPSILMSGRPIFEVPKETGHVVATLLYIITTSAMKEICHILKEYELEAHYAELNSRIKEAFAVEYINADGTMTKEYQGVYVLALQAGAVPENLREAALSRLVELIGENNNRLDTGFLSVQYLLPVLHENGRADIGEDGSDHHLGILERIRAGRYAVRLLYEPFRVWMCGRIFFPYYPGNQDRTSRIPEDKDSAGYGLRAYIRKGKL